MTQNIRHPKQKQGLFFPPFIRDWLSGSDFVWFVIDTVKSLKPFKASLYDEGKNLRDSDIAFHLICVTKAVETHP